VFYALVGISAGAILRFALITLCAPLALKILLLGRNSSSYHGTVDGTSRRHRRIRRLKKILRYLPRRANLESYPLLGRFADAARRRAFLWSFRTSEVFPAFLVGWVITLSPFYGLHTLLGICGALIFHGNIIVVLALQLISNPLLEPFILYLGYVTGKFAIASLGGISFPTESNWDFHSLKNIGNHLGRWFALTTFGSIILGYLCTFISCMVYKFFARRFVRECEKKR
jgi:uncharacterized protein (DUF2062 family)